MNLKIYNFKDAIVEINYIQILIQNSMKKNLSR